MTAIFVAQDVLKAAAFRGAPRHEFCALWKGGRRKFLGPAQKRGSCHQVRLRRSEGRRIAEKSIHRYVVPTQYFPLTSSIVIATTINLLQPPYPTPIHHI